MKVLVAYYSSTGNTGKLAKEIAKILSGEEGNKVDVEGITPVREYGGLGYISGVFGARIGAGRAITKPSKNASKYDLLAIGSPVWAGRPAPPVNAYIESLSLSCGPGKKAFVFVTSGGPNNLGALDVLANRLKAKGFGIVGKFGIWRGATFDEGELKAALKKAI